MTAGIAANRPIAVAISASAMAGATVASVACCTLPRAWNAVRMPQTVPNRPTYGLVEPIVASVERFCSSRSVSFICATFMARRLPSSSCAPARPSCVFSRENSRKPETKMPAMPVGELPSSDL